MAYEKMLCENEAKTYRVIHHSDMGYAVFHRETYQSGATSFWQQCTDWYQYPAVALKYFKRFTGMGV